MGTPFPTALAVLELTLLSLNLQSSACLCCSYGCTLPHHCHCPLRESFFHDLNFVMYLGKDKIGEHLTLFGSAYWPL